MSIKPDYLTLDSLLQKTLFRIPEYQRAYSWGTKQRADLFNDIKKLQQYESERHHFMATIVCLETKTKEEIGADEFKVYHVVDGQQRLTTLVIILKALTKYLFIEGDEQAEEAAKINKLLVKGDDRLILLQMNNDASGLFRNYLKDGTIPNRTLAKTAAEINLIEAFEECEAFVAEWEPDPLSLLKIIKNRLDFIFYVMEDEGAVYTIFEVLNSRGLEVDWLDKCKSMLMGIAFEKFPPPAGQEQINELHKSWTNIYRTIGLRKLPGHEILRFAATLRHNDPQSRIISAEDAIEFYRAYCETNPKEIIKVSETFLNLANRLEKLYANSRLRAVTDIAHARLLAVAVMLNGSLNSEEQAEVLRHWESVTFLIFGLGKKDSRTKVGDYTRLAQEIAINSISKSDIISNIDALPGSYTVDEALGELKESNCYDDWPNEDLLYFFYRYEEYLAEKAGASVSQETWEQIWSVSPTTTIEHIYPQNPGLEWKGKLGKGRGQEKHINRLGNLVLLPPGVNKEAGRKPFAKKKHIYTKHRQLKMIDEIIAKFDWNKRAIEDREKRLLDWAKATWGSK
ncbi:MAG: DUF262 domain-containing HNH endonuclease family protein [Proteobacteria bacterium]|nr:DUF262 domain-containing HNH endonuclease family protein [Pseudomonadota bacterium]